LGSINIFILLFLPIAFKAFQKTRDFFIIMFTLVFFQGFFDFFSYGSLNRRFIEILIYFFFFLKFINLRIKSTYLFYFLGIIAFSFISTFINGNFSLSFYSFLRIWLTKYLVFILAYNLVKEYDFIKIVKYIFILSTAQIFFTIIKLFSFGIRENIVGSITAAGGALNTIFPLIAISFLIIHYLYYKNIYSLLLIPFFFLMSWLGGKRGLYYYIIIVSFIIFIYYKKYNKNLYSYRYSLNIIILMGILSALTFIGVKNTANISENDGEFEPRELIDYGVSYNYKTGGIYTGRIGGMLAIIEEYTGLSDYWIINKKPRTKFIGYGPVELIEKEGVDDEALKNVRNIYAPTKLLLTGFSWYLLELGFIGAFLVLMFQVKILYDLRKIVKMETNHYFKFLSFSVFIFFIIILLDYISYSRSSTDHYFISLISFFFLGYLKKRYDSRNILSIN